MSKIWVEPSILAGDFGRLAEEAKRVEAAGADGIHVDIMDGHFVPNLSFGPKAVAAINRSTSLFLDVHLMVYHPFEYVERFVESGADLLTFHFEATEDVEKTLDYIHRCGIKAGLAFSPGTSMEMIPKYVKKCDALLLMTVEPGFGGQSFLPKVLQKVLFARKLCGEGMMIQVDGGIDEKTAPLCIQAGASHLISGTHLFEALNMAEAIEQLRR